MQRVRGAGHIEAQTVTAVHIKYSEKTIAVGDFEKLLERSMDTGESLEGLLPKEILPDGKIKDFLPEGAVILTPGQVLTAWRQSPEARKILLKYPLFTNQLGSSKSGYHKLDANGRATSITYVQFLQLSSTPEKRTSNYPGLGPVVIGGDYVAFEHRRLDVHAEWHHDVPFHVAYHIPEKATPSQDGHEIADLKRESVL